MEIFLSIIIGISLSAAAGFRVFIPFLVLSICSYAGWIDLGEGSSWIGSIPAMISFGVATAAEVGGYYVPWIDNMLDLISLPVSLVAGALLTSSVIVELDPLLKWTLAIVLGGGAALNTQMLTIKARALSSVFTTGLGNPIVSTIESVASTVISFLAIFLPFLALIALGITFYLIYRLIRKATLMLKA
jgi:hypothetical protein